jgi:GMP synthase-like glutamine amidotransferase
VADARVLVVQNSASDPVGRLGEWFQTAGLAVDVVEGPDLPANLDGVPGVVVLGGDMGAHDDDIAPWLPHERALLREAVDREVPTLAICLGAQLLAAATGGRVQPDPDGPEIGAQLVAKRTAASRDPLFAAVPITPDVHQWHYDAITVLPPGAILLASSPRGEHQAFRLGRLSWAVQFHRDDSGHHPRLGTRRRRSITRLRPRRDRGPRALGRRGLRRGLVGVRGGVRRCRPKSGRGSRAADGPDDDRRAGDRSGGDSRRVGRRGGRRTHRAAAAGSPYS